MENCDKNNVEQKKKNIISEGIKEWKEEEHTKKWLLSGKHKT